MKTTIYFKRYIKNDLKQVKQIEFYSNGEKYWRLNHALHREDGMAIERLNCYHEWWLKGIHYFHERQYVEALKKYKKKKKTVNR